MTSIVSISFPFGPRCVLCGEPANRGVRCQRCRDRAHLERFLGQQPAPVTSQFIREPSGINPDDIPF